MGWECARAPLATSSPARLVSEMPRPISGDRMRKQFRAEDTMAVGKATNLRMAAAVAGGKRALMREESPSPTTSDAPTALQYDLRTSHPPHQLGQRYGQHNCPWGVSHRTSVEVGVGELAFRLQ